MSFEKDKMKEILGSIDYEPKLEIISIPLPVNQMIMLSDGKRSRPRNPTHYLINTSHQNLDYMSESEMVRYAVRAVRCRRQSGENKLQTFVSIYLDVGEGLQKVISSMYFYSWGEYEADSQVYAIIAERFYERGVAIEKIAEMILMDASEVLNKEF